MQVCQTEKTFTEIMRCYRLQPQAASHVYRSVLLCSKQRKGGGSSNGTSTTSSPVPSETEYKGGSFYYCIHTHTHYYFRRHLKLKVGTGFRISSCPE